MVSQILNLDFRTKRRNNLFIRTNNEFWNYEPWFVSRKLLFFFSKSLKLPLTFYIFWVYFHSFSNKNTFWADKTSSKFHKIDSGFVDSEMSVWSDEQVTRYFFVWFFQHNSFKKSELWISETMWWVAQ